jgi:tetratricopeptide (TPR) repeat protein
VHELSSKSINKRFLFLASLPGLLLIPGLVFGVIWGQTLHAQDLEGDASDSVLNDSVPSESIQFSENFANASLPLDPALANALTRTEQLEPPDLPSPMRLDPMFTQFPELFTDESFKQQTLAGYREEKLALFDALYDRGIAARKREDYSQARSFFSELILERPPESYRRKALLQLALIAEKEGLLDQAIQVYGHYLSLFDTDSNSALVNLKMGQLFREMGAIDRSIDHFHLVISIVTKLKGLDDFYQPVLQRMALKAKIEMARTYHYDQAYDKAGRLYQRLLTQYHSEDPSVGIDEALVRVAVIDSFYSGELWEKAITSCLDFLEVHESHAKAPEVRFMLAKAYLNLGKGKEAEAAYQFKAIMQGSQGFELDNPSQWRRLKLNIGKEMAEAFLDRQEPELALEIYDGLLEEASMLPVGDQVSLLHRSALLEEELGAKQNALALYRKIIELTETEGDEEPSTRESRIRQMAVWKSDLLNWMLNEIRQPVDPTKSGEK